MTAQEFFRVNRLNQSQFDVLRALGRGDKTRQVAQALNLSQRAVRRRISRIRRCLGLDTTELVRMFAARFAAFAEEQPFEFCPGGQPELEFTENPQPGKNKRHDRN